MCKKMYNIYHNGICNIIDHILHLHFIMKGLIFLNANEKTKLADSIATLSNHQPCYLVIGPSATEEMFSDALCRISWSAIISTMENEAFAQKFSSANRELRIIDSIAATEPNKKVVPYLMIRYITEIESDSLDEDEIFRNIERDLAASLNKLMRDLAKIFVIGYNGSEFRIDSFDERICHHAITFFGANHVDEGRKNRLINKYGYQFHEEQLDEVLQHITQISDTVENETDCLIYVNGKLKSLSNADLLKTRDYVQLATKFAVEGNIPYGRAMQKKAFQTFLVESQSNSPQWYGYSPNTEFAVTRAFEAGLRYIVKCALSGDKMPDGVKYTSDKPIVLMGAASSGKSIALSALAYSIFQEKKYPVLFINSADKTLTLEGERFEQLDQLMQKIEQLDQNLTILLIWDCSSYKKNTFFGTREFVINKLINRGRKCVLVFSSYQHQDERSHNEECDSYFTWTGREYKAFPEANDFDGFTNLLSTDRYWIVNADRELNSKEIYDIKNKFKRLADVEPSSAWWERFHQNYNNNTIFEYFYHLTNLLRDGISDSLRSERDSFSNYHEQKLEEIFKSRMSEAFTLSNTVKALYKSLGIEYTETADEEQLQYYSDIFRDFQTCIALFSRFSLNTPRILAMHMLGWRSKSYYSTDQYLKKISQFAEKDIPWINYMEIDGKFYFGFRNNKEAELYIKEHFLNSVNGVQDYLDFINLLFETYSEIAGDTSIPDPEIVHVFSELMRSIGPNAPTFFGDDIPIYKNEVQNHLDQLIGMMDNIINQGLDHNLSLTINMFTFRREYFNKMLSNINSDSKIATEERCKAYETGLNGLYDTIILCDKALDNIDRIQTGYGNSQNQYSQIVNEKAQCNIRYFSYIQEYLDFCQQNNLTPNQVLCMADFPSDFGSLFSSIEKITMFYPSNGFYYNTIFYLFKKWCESKSLNEQLPYIGRLTSLVAQEKVYEVINRGSGGINELSNNIAWFNSHMSEIKGLGNISIRSIQTNDSAFSDFRKHYDEALNNGNASYIWLVSYKELYGNPSDNYQNFSDLSKSTLKSKCEYIYEFINSQYDVVQNDLNALNLLFKVYWMSITGEEPQKAQIIENECLTTILKPDQWRVIYKICYAYYELCLKKSIQPRPFMIYTLAVSCLYIGSDSSRFKECKKWLSVIEESSFGSEKRMYAPFVFCDEYGNPAIFKGRYKSIDNNGNGQIHLYSIDNTDFYFRARNIGEHDLNDSECRGKDINKDLVIAIGYTRFQIFSIEQIENKHKVKNDLSDTEHRDRGNKK